jgi:hypothetical protein
MSKEDDLLVKSDEGSCLTSLGSFLLLPIPFFAWLAISNLVIDNTSIVRHELPYSEGLLLVSIFLGFVLHEYCHYLFIRLLGGQPRYGKRKHKENRTYIERKYLFPITIRFWSLGTEFSLIQYLFIVLSPSIMTFLCLPAVMATWQNPVVTIVIILVGLTNSILIPMDFLVAGKLLASGGIGYRVVDKADGTHLIKR